MSNSMQNCMRSIHRQTLKCRIVVLWLDSLPSQLHLRLSSLGFAASDDHLKGTIFSRSALCVPRSLLEECLLASLRPCYGKQGLLSMYQNFALRGLGFGARYFSSDSSGSSPRSTIEALGDVDELNSTLGLANAYCSQAQLKSTSQQIEEIQSRLLDIGSAVAIPLNNPFSDFSKKVPRVKFNAATVQVLESWRAQMDEEVPHQTGFILPSGGLPAASLHVARSICRRAERKMITLVEEQVVDESVVRYLNRLSDYLFTAARYAASKLEKPETSWRINQRR